MSISRMIVFMTILCIQKGGVYVQMLYLKVIVQKERTFHCIFQILKIQVLKKFCDITDKSVENLSVNMDHANKSSKSDNNSNNNNDSINEFNVLMDNDDINKNTFSNGYYVNDNGTKSSYKRKISSCKNYPNKKIKFCNNYITEWISRKDFVSDESWERFIRFYNYQKRIINNNYQKIFRKGKKVDILKKQKEELLKKQILGSKYVQVFNLL